MFAQIAVRKRRRGGIILERITIIGVGPVGASIGKSLMERNLKSTEVVISSADRSVLSAASKLGAAHKVESSLSNALSGAKLVVLDSPVGETRGLMDVIGPMVERDAVVTDTASVKRPVMRWADEFLPKDAAFVGGHPLLKSVPDALEDADAAVFRGAKYAVTPGEGADEQAIRTVVGLVEALGAHPVFLDPAEHDSYAAAMHHLPVVMSAAFVTATAGSDGWREMHQLAESQFNAFGKHAANHPEDNEAICLADPQTLTHWIDQLILELYNYRNEINAEDGDDALVERFTRAWELRARWEADDVVPKTNNPIPSAGDSIMSMFLGERLASRLKPKDDDDNRKFRLPGRRR